MFFLDNGLVYEHNVEFKKISANGNDLICVSKNVLHEDEDLEVGENITTTINSHIYRHMRLTTDEDIEANIIFIKKFIRVVRLWNRCLFSKRFRKAR